MTATARVPEPTRHYEHFAWDNNRWDAFVPRDDDILVCSAYKSGTTWTQMICAMLVFQDTELYAPLTQISPWLEIKSETIEDVVERLNAQTHRRFYKSHTPLDGLPWYPDMVYIFVGRAPLDIFMSMHNHLQNANPESDALWVQAMRAEGETLPEPPDDPNELMPGWLSEGSFAWEQDGAPYWSAFHHCQTFWEYRDLPNIHFLHYADMKADLAGAMRRLAGLLGIEIDEGRFPALVEAATFDKMKANADRLAPESTVNMWKDNSRFFHKGTSGQWKDVLTPENVALYEKTMSERYDAEMMAWLTNGGPVST